MDNEIGHNISSNETCPRCGAPTLRNWRELTIEERDTAQRISGATLAPTGDPERYCTRCLYAEFTPTMREC